MGGGVPGARGSVLNTANVKERQSFPDGSDGALPRARRRASLGGASTLAFGGGYKEEPSEEVNLEPSRHLAIWGP